MNRINHAKITVRMDLSARYQRQDVSADSSHSSVITYDCELEKVAGSGGDVIAYASKKCTVSYKLSDKNTHTMHMYGGASPTTTSTTTGSGTFTNAAPHGDYNDFVELSIHPAFGIYKFTAYSNSGKIECVTVDQNGRSSSSSTAQFNFNPTYYMDSAAAKEIKGSDSWTVKKYFSISNMDFAQQRMVALNAAMSGSPQGAGLSKETMEVSIRYPMVPTVDNSPSVIITEDPSAKAQGTISAEWLFTAGASSPVTPPPGKKPVTTTATPYRKGSGPVPRPEEAAAFADKIVGYYRAGNYSGMYGLLSKDMRSSMSSGNWTMLCNSQKQMYGALNRYERSGQHAEPSAPGVTTVEYRAVFSGGAGSIMIGVVKEAGALRAKVFLVYSSSMMEQAQNIMSQAGSSRTRR